MAAYKVPETKSAARILWKEGQELNLIFAAIIRNSKKTKDLVIET